MVASPVRSSCPQAAPSTERAWRRADGAVCYPGQRGREQLIRGEWDCARGEHIAFSSASTEAHPTSVYGATKLAQEHILEAWALAFGSKLSILRLQNVYGPGQSLINSYTGIVALFARLAREGKSIPLYEDGQMQRDFVYIEDVVSAILAAIDVAPAGTIRGDIGVGGVATIRQVAEFMARRYHAPDPYVSGAYRHGDVRHASCDISRSMSLLQWIPRWSLEQGLEALCVWIDDQLSSVAAGPRETAPGPFSG